MLDSGSLFLFVFLLRAPLKHVLILPVPQPHFSWWCWKVFKVTAVLPWVTMKGIRKKKGGGTQKESPCLSDAQQCLYFNYREREARLNRESGMGERKNYVGKPDAAAIKRWLPAGADPVSEADRWQPRFPPGRRASTAGQADLHHPQAPPAGQG